MLQIGCYRDGRTLQRFENINTDVLSRECFLNETKKKLSHGCDNSVLVYVYANRSSFHFFFFSWTINRRAWWKDS
jgi:hypothetical protein